MFLIKYTKVLILGSGPSGYTSSIYVLRSYLNPILITGNKINGQLVSTVIENWPGFIKISGLNLMINILDQLKFMKIEIIFDFVYLFDFLKKPFFSFGLINFYFSDLLIIATGLKPKYLFLKNENKYFGKNISFCSICDANFYKNKIVVIIGGGNSAFENALYLSNLVKKIILIHRNINFKVEIFTLKNILKKKNIFYRLNFIVDSLFGDFYKLIYIKIKNILNNILNVINIDGFFISIGNLPNTGFFLGQLKLSKEKYILTYNYSNCTNINGVFSCGDVNNFFYKQAIIASANGASAALDLINYYNNYFF